MYPSYFTKRSGVVTHPIYVGVLGLLLLIAACKKVEIGPDVPSDPVFVQNFTIDNATFEIFGGQDKNIYMFSDFQKDGNIITKRISAFAPESCPEANCPGSLRFEFLSFPFLEDSIELFYVGSPANPIYKTTFDFSGNLAYDNVQIFFDDVLTFEGKPSGSVLIFDLSGSPIDCRVVAQSSSPDSFVYTSVRTIHPGNPDANFIYPQVSIVTTKDSMSYILLAESSVQQYLWSNGNTDAAINVFQDTLNQPYLVTVTNSEGNTASASISNLLSTNILPPVIYGYSATPDSVVTTAEDIIIQWVDAEGFIWRSDAGAQPSDASFFVSKNEAYDNNEKNQKTRKLEISYACRIFKEGSVGQVKWISGSGTIAVAGE